MENWSGDRTKLPLSVNGLAGQILRATGGSLMSASSFIVNLQWYLVHPPSLPSFSYPEDEPSTPPPRTHENIPYQYPPRRLTLPTESNSEYDRKSRLPLPPSVLGSATNYCIGNRLDYQSFDNASELFRVARRASLGTPFVHPISPSLPFHSVCVCVCVCSTPRQIICSDEAWIPTVITFRLIFN